MTARRQRRTYGRPPVLAMVDAFVGGTAVLLILIVLSSNLQDSPGTQPQADVVLRCDGGNVVAMTLPEGLPAMPPLPPAKAASWLATHPHPARLLTRVRLNADQRAYRCANTLQKALVGMNDLTEDFSARDPAQDRAILLLTVVIVPPEEASQ